MTASSNMPDQDYGEPIRLESRRDPEDGCLLHDIVSTKGVLLYDVCDDDDTRRIISTYNACRGLTDPEAQIRKLIEACRMLLDYVECETGCDGESDEDSSGQVRKARSALAPFEEVHHGE